MPPVLLARRATQLSPVMPASAPDDKISFDSGHAYPGVLPDLTAEADDALSKFRPETLQYAPRPGLPELREWIAGHMAADGAAVAADNILVTNGAKHALELVCRLTIDEGDAVIVTCPTYFSAIPIIRSYGAAFVEVPQDQDGMDVDALARMLDQRRASRTVAQVHLQRPRLPQPDRRDDACRAAPRVGRARGALRRLARRRQPVPEGALRGTSRWRRSSRWIPTAPRSFS